MGPTSGLADPRAPCSGATEFAHDSNLPNDEAVEPVKFSESTER